MEEIILQTCISVTEEECCELWKENGDGPTTTGKKFPTVLDRGVPMRFDTFVGHSWCQSFSYGVYFGGVGVPTSVRPQPDPVSDEPVHLRLPVVFCDGDYGRIVGRLHRRYFFTGRAVHYGGGHYISMTTFGRCWAWPYRRLRYSVIGGILLIDPDRIRCYLTHSGEAEMKGDHDHTVDLLLLAYKSTLPPWCCSIDPTWSTTTHYDITTFADYRWATCSHIGEYHSIVVVPMFIVSPTYRLPTPPIPAIM